jgi:ABC-type transport system involved in cytochrome bd biosynthesis fused ATPase/permease subunit
MFMGVGCSVRMGMLMDVCMFVFMVMGMDCTFTVSVCMLMLSCFVIGSAIAGLAHILLLSMWWFVMCL